ncbi:class I SAM-dependent methyltransferase [Anaerobaca lacustris]|uniref:Methyltransferase domain-containing protein n=1 Tax=Anaerobaca lacustris TaxID=3044600 RepID=A0AAW6TUP3_9BACT|nr:methyltransferase domain-containing protein [Sedimentisphaerales bacterium M17dextr]MDI9432601.1 methyltransferase domain-containing protein [Planctomycetota bacterium]
MEPQFKIDLATVLGAASPTIIELGCGGRKTRGRIGVDRVDLPTVDIVTDIENGLPFLPNRSVDEIHCRSVLEHIENFEFLFTEMIRVLKDDGRAHIFVPHFSNPYYYSDYTHKRPFGLYTFYYFTDQERQPRRKVPSFYTDVRIEILSLKLKFRSPVRLFHYPRKLLGALVNLHPALQEFYEAGLCYLAPCDGIEVILRPDRSRR